MISLFVFASVFLFFVVAPGQASEREGAAVSPAGHLYRGWNLVGWTGIEGEWTPPADTGPAGWIAGNAAADGYGTTLATTYGGDVGPSRSSPYAEGAPKWAR
jgi:hypothetical protein